MLLSLPASKGDVNSLCVIYSRGVHQSAVAAFPTFMLGPSPGKKTGACAVPAINLGIGFKPIKNFVCLQNAILQS